MGLILILLQAYQNIDTAISYSLKKANTLAEVVQSGLTAHMLTNMMDKRQIFLDSIASVQYLKIIFILNISIFTSLKKMKLPLYIHMVI